MAIAGLNPSNIPWDEYSRPISDTIFSTSMSNQGPGITSASPIGSRFADAHTTQTYTDHMIQGKTYVVEQTYPELQFQIQGPESVKTEMCKMLVDELFRRDSIEFTNEKEPHTGNVRVRARIFATENSDIQILRTNNLIK